MNKDGTGTIGQILERKNYISRKAPRIKGAAQRGERLEQIIASNFENLIAVTSTRQPNFNNRFLDRLIVTGESANANVIIVINKVDLEFTPLQHWMEIYRSMNYEVIITSVKSGLGIDALHEMIKGRTNLFWGASGVGKSSLLNKLFPRLDLKIREISNATSKGKHTTVTVLMKKLERGTFIIDTPGIREIDPYGIKKEDLAHYFKDFPPFINACRFNTCTHHHEPGCNVQNAVRRGAICEERYESYLNLLSTIEDDMLF